MISEVTGSEIRCFVFSLLPLCARVSVLCMCVRARVLARHVEASIVKDGRSVGCRGEASSMTPGQVLVVAIWVNGMSLMVGRRGGDSANVYIVGRFCFLFFSLRASPSPTDRSSAFALG